MKRLHASKLPVADMAQQMAVALTDDQVAAIEAYVRLLHKWNQRINLSGSRTPEALLSHVVDCMALLAHLPATATRAIDVGSGAGLPGAVVATLRPEIDITALEPVHKKHAFLATVRRELSLDNFHPLSQRMEEHRAHADFIPYDLAMSRATFALPSWLAHGRTLVGEGGTVLAMEGNEEHPLPAHARRFRYTLTDRKRAVIVAAISSQDPAQDPAQDSA